VKFDGIVPQLNPHRLRESSQLNSSLLKHGTGSRMAKRGRVNEILNLTLQFWMEAMTSFAQKTAATF